MAGSHPSLIRSRLRCSVATWLMTLFLPFFRSSHCSLMSGEAPGSTSPDILCAKSWGRPSRLRLSLSLHREIRVSNNCWLKAAKALASLRQHVERHV